MKVGEPRGYYVALRCGMFCETSLILGHTHGRRSLAVAGDNPS